MDTLQTIVLLAGAGWLAHQVFEVVVRPRFRTLAKVPGPRTNLLFGFFALANEVDFVYDVLKWREQFGSTFVVNSAFGGLAVMVRPRPTPSSDRRPLTHHRRATRARFSTSPSRRCKSTGSPRSSRASCATLSAAGSLRARARITVISAA
jgi:hypothetical protein